MAGTNNQQEVTQRQQAQLSLISRITKISGAMFIVLGGAIYIDFLGIATDTGLTESDIHHILGPVLFIVGLVDIIVISRLVERALAEKK